MKTLHSSLLFVSAALLLNQPYTGAAGQWEPTGSMVVGRAQPTATLMPNGDVLVIGGYTGNSLPDAERYHPTKGTWRKIISFPSGLVGHTAFLLANGKILVAGVYDSDNQPVVRANLYDPVTGKWTHTGAL